MEELAKQLGYSTAPFIYAGAAYGLFHWLDEKASDEAKAALARTMSLKDYKNEQIASALVEVFDRIYTYPLLRWRAFFRSLLFTTVVTAIFVFELRAVYGIYSKYEIYYRVVFERLSLGLLFNAFTDYLSLFVIRPMLTRSGKRPVIFLALGAVSGAAIVLVANSLRKYALFPNIVEYDFGDTRYTFIGSDFAYKVFEPFYIWPALAVFTWLPLLALGILMVRLLTPLSWIVGRTQWFLKEGKEHPLKAIGYVAAVVVFLGTVVGRAVFSA
jgi:hypothetical protein